MVTKKPVIGRLLRIQALSGQTARCLFACWLFSSSVKAQVNLPDSIRDVRSSRSTILKTRPLAAAFGSLNLAVEQTLGKRSSVEIGATQFVALWSFTRLLGRSQGVSASFRYYPLTNQAAPSGFYVGSGAGYARTRNSDFLRFLTFLTTTTTIGDASIFSIQALTGYQFVSPNRIVLDVQGSIGLANRLAYRPDSPSTQPAVPLPATVGRIVPGLTVSVGYRWPRPRR